MKKKDRRAFGQYVRWIADSMGLRDWYIDVHFSLDEDASDYGTNHIRMAQVEPTYGRKHAVVTVVPDIRDYDLEKIRMVVCHELTHLHLAALQDQCERDLENIVGKLADEVFYKSFRRNLEYAVDGIASAWAESFPMIEWP